MRFAFSRTNTSGDLPLIPEYPEGQLVRVQGYNGIGKTLAIRLLQLATGHQPYLSMSNAWGNLKDSLGGVTVQATGLKNGSTLTVHIDPSGWPDHPLAVDEWLGTAELDGGTIPIGGIPPLLRVFRIAGDETLAESLAQRVQRDREQTNQVWEQIEEAGRSWDFMVKQVESAVGDVRSGQIAALNEKLEEIAQRLSQAKALHAEVAEQNHKMEEVERLRLKHQAINNKLPEINRRLKELGAEETEAKKRLRELDEESSRILSEEKRSKALSDQFDHDERLLRLRRDRLQKRIWEVQQALESMDGPPDIDRDDPDATKEVASYIRELKKAVRELERERQSVDRQGLVLEVADEIDEALQRGIADDLGSESIADIRGELVSIEDLSDGIDTFENELPEVSQHVEQIRARIEIARSDLKAADELGNALRLHTKARKDVDETESDLLSLLERLTDPAASSYRELQSQRSELVDKLARNAIEKGELNDEIHELLDEGDLESLEQKMTAHGLDFSDDESIERAIAEVTDELKNSEDILSEIANEEGEVKAELRAQIASVRSATQRLLESDDISWLRQTLAILPDQKTSPEEQEAVVAEIGFAAGRFADSLLAVTNDVQALFNALDWLTKSIQSGSQPGHESRRFVPILLRRYEREFAAQLSAPEVLKALFDGGSDLQVDLSKLTTTWLTKESERRSRPLEAFSSGEKAFAYTRVQLEQVSGESADNKVVFLDEFGAYVARDRLEELESFIRKRALPDIADQVIIVLPLTQEPRDEADQRQLADSGYFYEVLD